MSSELELFKSLEDIHPTSKMDDLKPISHKDFNKFMKGKGFRGRKDYSLKDLKTKFDFKPLVERTALVVFSEYMEPAMFGSMREASKAISMVEGPIRYERNNGRDFMKSFKGGSVREFSIKWCQKPIMFPEASHCVTSALTPCCLIFETTQNPPFC